MVTYPKTPLLVSAKGTHWKGFTTGQILAFIGNSHSVQIECTWDNCTSGHTGLYGPLNGSYDSGVINYSKSVWIVELSEVHVTPSIYDAVKKVKREFRKGIASKMGFPP